MKTFPFRRPAHWLAAGAVGAAVWVFVADPFPQPALPESTEIEISDVQYLRPAIKRQLTRDLIGESRSLFEVAALYYALDRLPPLPDRTFAEAWADPRVTPEERICRYLIAAVQSDLIERNLNSETTVAHLEADLHQAMNQPGGLKLPDAAELEPIDVLLAKARQKWCEARRQDDLLRHPRPRNPGRNGSTEKPAP